jgi:hypothetical protein
VSPLGLMVSALGHVVPLLRQVASPLGLVAPPPRKTASPHGAVRTALREAAPLATAFAPSTCAIAPRRGQRGSSQSEVRAPLRTNKSTPRRAMSPLREAGSGRCAVYLAPGEAVLLPGRLGARGRRAASPADEVALGPCEVLPSRRAVPRKSVALSQLRGQPAPDLRAPEVVFFRLPRRPRRHFQYVGFSNSVNTQSILLHL